MTGGRILVVDDDLTILDVVREMLADGGYAVDSAPDGLQGLRLLERNQYDAVITDLLMPGMDGYEFAARARAQYRGPIIAFSASTNRRSEHFDYFLEKPFDCEQLYAMLPPAAPPEQYRG